MMTRIRLFVGLSAGLLLMTAASSPAWAQLKPLKINGEGVILDDVLLAPGATARHCASGRGTAGLGHYEGLGEVRVDDPMTGAFSSATAFLFRKNGNGHTLAMQYGRTDSESGASPVAQQSGIVMLLPAEDPGLYYTVWLAEFNPVPSQSTGKFADVSAGSLLMLATSEPFALGLTEEGIAYIPAGTGYTWEGEGTILFEK